ncbi:MAG TPA: outer membrane protein transport protein [Burkholderiales bacterium]|nr:outer membrane protein transport protein [Burkholderiales bacterium]
MKKIVTTGSIALALIGAGVKNSSAAGFALIEQNGSGMGNAFAGAAAVAEDASTIFFNPAGMAMIPSAQVVVAGHAINFKADFSDAGSSLPLAAQAIGRPKGKLHDDAGDLFLIPNLYFVLPINERIAVGLGLNAPFALKTEYEDLWVGRFQGIKTELKTINVNPALSLKVNERIMLGVGIDYQMADATLTNAVILPGPNEGRAKLEVDDSSWGWNAGALFKLGDDMRVGVSYRSAIKYTLDGDIKVSFLNGVPVAPASGGTKVDITFPDSASLSVVQSYGPQWDLLGDVTWTHWSRIGTINAVNTTTGALRDVLRFNFNDTWRISFGANYRPNSQWTIRGGIAWDQSPVDKEDRTVRLPDQDRYWVAVGVKWMPMPKLGVDLGYAHLFVPDADINLTRNQVGGTVATASTVRGSYEGGIDILSLQLTYSF